jgi:hypothetical protein
MYINNCTTNLKNPLMLYADDCKLLGLAEYNLNLSTMQEDLDRLSRWSSDWCLQFNALKCKVLHLGHNTPKLAYHLGDAQLEAVSEEKDLGVIVDNELKFHCPPPLDTLLQASTIVRNVFEGFEEGSI